MAGEWGTVELGEVAAVRSGYAFKSSDWKDAGIPVVKIANVKGGRLEMSGCSFVSESTAAESGEFQLSTGDILIAMTGYIGDVARVRRSDLPCALNQRVGKFSVRDDKRLDVDFLYTFLSWAETRRTIEGLGYGSAQPNVSPSLIHNVEIPLPPLAEQQAIAAVIGALDDKIELNRRMNAKLEEMARALFQSWFVDFDPVRAKLDGREPFGLDRATASLFPEHFEHGKHGILPVGWHCAAIEEVCAINAWTLGKNDDLEMLEYIEISEVSRGNIAKIATYQRGEEPSRARRRLRNGDTVLSTVRPDRGSHFLSLNPPKNRVCSTGFAVLTPSKVPWSYLHVALTLPEVSDHLGQMADGGAYPAVRPEVIGAMQVSLPKNPKVLEAFHRTCAPLFEQAEANRTQSRTLATLRDTLLPRLLSGEL